LDATVFDAVIIGGGPAGATAGLVLARAGLRALIIEKQSFPRFHIGESMLPRCNEALKELGLEEKVRALPHMPKYGGEFAMGGGTSSTRFRFSNRFNKDAPTETFNIERSHFDQLMLNSAVEAGAELRQATVKSILKLEDGDVAVALADGAQVRARWLLDASGQWAMVARHLKTRQALPDKHLQKVAYFSHFEGVKRPEGLEEGHPCIVMADEGWFWLIPVNKTLMSVGLVIESDMARRVGVPATKMLRWGIERCPFMRDRCGQARIPDENEVISNFSYRCRPYAGPGYFLLGDAAAFLDPIFSTGTTLGILSGKYAAERVIDLVGGQLRPQRARRQYIRYFERSTAVFWKLIRSYYDHSFRELFLEGQGPMEIHRAVLAVLAGNVFPRPNWALRWRLQAFYAFMWLNRRHQRETTR
jgi:flavin-dependent dehydrogenase